MIFTNSQTMIIEYMDIIKSPAALMIFVNLKSKGFKDIFDISELEGMSYDNVYDWYVKRTHINPLRCIPTKIPLQDDELDSLYYTMLREHDYCKTSPLLNGMSIIKKVMEDKLCKKYVIYVPYMIENIILDIGELFAGFDYEVVVEDMALLREYDNDSTYMLSDISKIHSLYHMDKLSLSALLIASNYRYNIIDDSYMATVDKYTKHDDKHTIFKFSFFNVTRI